MAVIYRKIVTSLEVKCRQPGGKKISECLADATSRLVAMQPQLLAAIDERLDQIQGLAGCDGARPYDHQLEEIHRLADECIGYCAGVDFPGLADTLIALCRLSDAAMASTNWIRGCFEPLLRLARTCRNGALTRSDITVVAAEIDRCISRFDRARPRVDEPMTEWLH